jgi:patatin-related protein
MAEPPPSAAAFEFEQEVRLAVVLYGGLSLAIYMYGVAEELLHFVRATAPSSSDAGKAHGTLAVAKPESTEAIYRKLGRLLPLGFNGSDGSVRTRFVVDIVTGTSAGGINGICLAKALAQGSRLQGLKDLWLQEGDIKGLVNDEQSALPDEGLPFKPPPRSLLTGDRMLIRCIDTFEAMDASNGSEPLVDELDLWVTTTDLEGLELPLQIENATIREPRYANRFHFRYSKQDGVNDFESEDNKFLAFASRCTSAFPFAFEPSGLERASGCWPQGSAPDADWRRFYRDYARARPPFAVRLFSDGGILDNKPFTYATESLVRRRALIPVVRKLVYVEPDPATAAEEARSWNALTVARAAVLTIPRFEAIRNDIQSVLMRNRRLTRMRDIVSRIGADATEGMRVLAVARKVQDDEWAARSLSETIKAGAWGPSYGTYHRLKVRGVVDYLAELVVRAAGLDPTSDDQIATHYLVRAWKEQRFAEEPARGQQSENRFLLAFSLPYRWRRINFVLQKLDELRAGDEAAITRTLEPCFSPDEAERISRADLRTGAGPLRRKLTYAQDKLYGAERSLTAPTGALATSLRRLELGRRDLEGILAGRTDAGMLKAATTIRERVADDFEELIEIVRRCVAKATDDAREDVDKALGKHFSTRIKPDPTDASEVLRYVLRFYYDAFEAYDLILYPLEFGGELGETNPVDIIRISPVDSELPEEVGPAGRALRGAAIGHFGAFFNAEWRKHDMVWGRLNAAEGLFRMLLPEDDPQLKRLIDEAHDRIIDDFCASDLDIKGSQNARERFAEYNPATRLSPEEATLAVLDRCSATVGALIAGITESDGGMLSKAAPLWAALRTAMRPNPGGTRGARNVLGVLFRHWRQAQLALAFWLMGLAAGGALVAVDVAGVVGHTWPAGLALLVLFILVAIGVLVGTRIAVKKIRGAIAASAGRFIFGAPQDHR